MKFGRLRRFVVEKSGFGCGNGRLYSSMVKPRPNIESQLQLYRRIAPVGDRNISILPILYQWLAEGRSVDKQTLKFIISKLRNYKRYTHALQLSMYMTDNRHYELTSQDVAIHLELISKSQGIEQAELYFNSLSKNHKHIRALLTCYTTSQCVEKAEGLMQKMSDLGYVKRTIEYNLMLNLYYKTGNMEKLDALLQEMEMNGIVRDRYTLGILINAYASVMDIEKMDKVAVIMMESAPDWTTYTTAAAGYIKVGVTDKALEMLKEAEACLPNNASVPYNYSAAAAGYIKVGVMDKALEMLKKAEACLPNNAYVLYNYLLIQYATIGRRDEVLRVWSRYKKEYKVYNKGYSHVLNSLVKLGDFEMAKKIFVEWHYRHDLAYDINILNIMLGVYSKNGFLEKAEAILGRVILEGVKPNAQTCYHMVEGYLQNEKPDKAVKMMKKTIGLLSGKEGDPVPEVASLKACLEYLKGVGDTEQTEELLKLLASKKVVSLDELEEVSMEISRPVSRNGFHSNFYSPKAIPNLESSRTELYRRISPVRDQTVSISPILDQWVKEGRFVDEGALNYIINRLRDSNRYNHALQISFWMTDKRYFKLTPSAVAIQLDLIAKTQGIQQAELYFSSIPQQFKGFQVYGAVLHAFVNAKCVEKAEMILQEMNDAGVAKNRLLYNDMLNLYYKTRDMEKFDALLLEMEENGIGIVRDRSTQTILLIAYTAVMDIEKIDKIVSMMESDPKAVFHWPNYSAAAACYEKAGLLDKAFEVLKKVEARLTSQTIVNVYCAILRHYATIGKKDEVLRFWSFCKKMCKVNNQGYITILRSLLKLGDFEMAEKIFYEWESRDDRTYDINIPKYMIAAYSEKGLIEKAEALIDRIISEGQKLHNFTWYCLVKSCLKNGQPEKAVQMMKKAIVNSKPGWKTDMAVVEACMEYLKGVGDNEQIEEFANLFQVKIPMWMDVKREFEPGSEDDAMLLPLVSEAKGMQQAVEVNGIGHGKLVECDPDKVDLNWTNYSATATVYKKAGLLDKASEMLKEAEACLTSETLTSAYFTILPQYATIGNKDEVLRFWSFYKNKCKVNNNAYMCILSSLVKLGDYEMAEEIFYEWESRDDLTYDMNIPNFIIAAYAKEGLIEKAEALIDRAISKGGKPNTWTWYCLVQSYLKNEQPEKAVEMMKKALVNSKPGWKPNMKVVKACLEYLKGLGDKEQAEEYLELLQVKIPMWMDARRDFEPGSEDDANRLPLVSKAKGMEQAAEVNGTVHDKTDKIGKIVESDPKVVLNWTNYSAAAVGYKKAGLLDKALEMLKKAEACLTSETCILAYSAILRQYATIGNKDEVLRFWSFFKNKCKVNNNAYMSILSSLVKLGDYEMAEEIFYEWESRDDLTYDMNIPNLIIAAYAKKGLIEKAEALIDKAISKGGKPNTWTWYRLVNTYLENEQPEKAVEMMKRAIVNSEPGWKPSMELVNACLCYLKGVGDNKQIVEFTNLLMLRV